MLANEDPGEDELEGRQGSLYPVGRALRNTFDAENHESLGTDLTGLMLELARIEPELPAVPGRGAMPMPAANHAPEPSPVATRDATSAAAGPAARRATPAPSWWRSVVDKLLD